MSGTTTRHLVPIAAAALAATALPLALGGPADAAAAGKPAFAGYSATAVSTPVRLEIYEPTIPVPASPQGELDLAYTKVDADSGSATARASWLWPGDSVGEGMKTFVTALGLPEQLGENGYPLQVNAGYPSGDAEQSDEPFPGSVMRTRAAQRTSLAQAGLSPDGQVQDGTRDSSQQGGGPDAPGVPTPPALPPAPTGLATFGQAITGSQPAAGAATPSRGDAAAGAPGLPPELAALVDAETVASSTRNDATAGRVVTTARSALGDVSLLGGLITLDHVATTTSSTSDGRRGVPTDTVRLGGLTIAGQAFTAGPDGFEVAGRSAPVAGLPADPNAALRQLGIELGLPTPQRQRAGDQASSTAAGLRVDVDLTTLRHQLDVLPIATIVDAFPNDPQQLKSAVQTLTGLSPRIVLTLGSASTQVDTVQGLALPGAIPGTATGGTAGGAAAAGAAGSAGSAPAPAAPGAPGAAPAGTAAAAGDLPPSRLTGSGLPPLYSLPGALLVGGIGLAAIGGTWLRRIGVAALGGAGSCSHGLDSGLPDLRKAP